MYQHNMISQLDISMMGQDDQPGWCIITITVNDIKDNIYQHYTMYQYDTMYQHARTLQQYDIIFCLVLV